MTPYTIIFRESGGAHSTALTAGQHFRCDIEEYEGFFGEPLPALLVDLLRIASGIYVVDRLIKRRRQEQRRWWSRSLSLKVGLLEPDFWSDHEVHAALTETVEFLTDDTWEFSFDKDDRRRGRNGQKTLFRISPESRVCLYSGGLDSAAGLANRIANGPQSEVLPVTIWHQPIQRRLIQKQHKLLTSKYDVLISPLIMKAALIWTPEIQPFREELTQRGRAFLFTAAGAVAAAMAGATSVEIYESGIGAINLPFMAGMVGSRMTRSVHPEFVRNVSRLVSLVVEKPITFAIPFGDQTKGQLVKAAADHGLHDLVRSTVSCVHYPLRESRHKQCGVCPACIFRRQAVSVAGIREPATTYKYDLFDSPSKANRVSLKRLKYMRAFLDQVVQLDEVAPQRRLPARLRRHLLGTRIITDEQSPGPIIRLLSEYRDEWREIAARAARQGFSWAGLLEPSTPRQEGASRA